MRKIAELHLLVLCYKSRPTVTIANVYTASSSDSSLYIANTSKDKNIIDSLGFSIRSPDGKP